MQPDNAPSRTFLHRTDRLAVELGVDIQDLPAVIGISRRTLFAARADPDAASSKTLLKLEAAEKKAGIHQGKPMPGGESETEDPLPEVRMPSDFELFELSTPRELEIARNAIQAWRMETATFDRLRGAMTEAGAWPPNDEDSALSIADLVKKYLPI